MISDDGIEFSNVNTGQHFQITKAAVIQQVESGTGDGFHLLSGLAYEVAYSAAVTDMGDVWTWDQPGQAVDVSGMYDLRFTREGGVIRLRGVAYVNLEDR